MSDHDSRRKNVSEQPRMTELLDLARRRQADAEALLARLDMQLAERKRQFWARRLAEAEVVDWRGDGAMREWKTDFTKGLEMIGGVFAEITRVTRHGGMLVIEATGHIPVGETSRVRSALRAVLKTSPGSALLQMHDRRHPEAGALLEGAVTPGGEVF